MTPAMRRPACVLLLLSAAACSGGLPKKDPGPAPGPDHQEQVRHLVDGLLDAKYHLEAPSRYRFEAPTPGRVARWHFDPQVEGRPGEFGYVHGWCVEFRVTPSYVGYPEQPESQRMAFWIEGKLRGIFLPGPRNAPLELDRWVTGWVDESWHPPARPQPPR